MADKIKHRERCHVCERPNAIDFFEKPIKHWCCRKCTSVFVIGDDGTLSHLNAGVEYHQTD